MSNGRYHATGAQYAALSERSLSKALAENRITQDDADLITSFVASLSKGKISPGREFKITSVLCSVSRYFDTEFSRCTEDDLNRALKKIRNATKPDGTPYKLNTRTDYLKNLKRFFLWLSKKGLTSIPKEEIADIETGGYDMQTKSDEDVLTADEINAIIAAAKTPKYKAYFGTLYETGARSVELANLRWKDVKFEPWGAKVTLTDNKGQKITTRTTPVITYASYLAAWKGSYPFDPLGDAYVFLTNRGEPLQYRGVQKALSNFVKDAGIEKKVTLHRFRHSRITHAIRGGMSETLAKKAFWGNSGTDMIQVYEHLTDSDIENEFARQAGVDIAPDETRNEAPEPVQCSQCHFVNPPGSQFCGLCGMALSRQALESRQEAIEKLEELLRSGDAQSLELVLAALQKK